MIKFILQRQVNLSEVKKRRNLSHLHLNNTLDAQLTFSPYNEYKQSEQQIQQLSKRLLVLDQQQKKMESKAISNSNRLKNYQRIRQQINLQRKKSEQYRKQLIHQMNITRQLVANTRQIEAKKLQQTKRQMYFQKWTNYLDQRDNYKSDMNISTLETQIELIKKKNNKKEIQKLQEMTRQRVQQYYITKREQIRQTNALQKARMNSMTESKIDQIDSLTHIESILLSKQAKSRMSSQQSTARLNNIFPLPKPKSKANMLGARKKSTSNSDIYIV